MRTRQTRDTMEPELLLVEAILVQWVNDYAWECKHGEKGDAHLHLDNGTADRLCDLCGVVVDYAKRLAKRLETQERPQPTQPVWKVEQLHSNRHKEAMKAKARGRGIKPL